MKKLLLCVILALLCAEAYGQTKKVGAKLIYNEEGNTLFVVEYDPTFGACASLTYGDKELGCGAILYKCGTDKKQTFYRSTLKCRGQEPTQTDDPEKFFNILVKLSPRFAEEFVIKVCRHFGCGK
jgi:hypothetical protein